MYIDTPKSIPSYFDILYYSLKAFLYWLWHRRHCGKHHTGDHLEWAILPYLQRHRRGLSSIWTHLQRLTICTSSSLSNWYIQLITSCNHPQMWSCRSLAFAIAIMREVFFFFFFRWDSRNTYILNMYSRNTYILNMLLSQLKQPTPSLCFPKH